MRISESTKIIQAFELKPGLSNFVLMKFSNCKPSYNLTLKQNSNSTREYMVSTF